MFAFRVFLRLNEVSIPSGGAYLEFARAFVETVGAKPEERASHIEGLVGMVQQWIDAASSTVSSGE